VFQYSPHDFIHFLNYFIFIFFFLSPNIVEVIVAAKVVARVAVRVVVRVAIETIVPKEISVKLSVTRGKKREMIEKPNAIREPKRETKDLRKTKRKSDSSKIFYFLI
jgi:hypothetical protein